MQGYLVTGRVAPPSPGGFLFERMRSESLAQRIAERQAKMADHEIRHAGCTAQTARSERDFLIDDGLAVDSNHRRSRTGLRRRAGLHARAITKEIANLFRGSASDAGLRQCIARDFDHFFESRLNLRPIGRVNA
ncbi:hypothetical protein [Caballeronia arvi]|uniref:hypothetical protein n=1 Tax=Caballeronia arvi TaxID=1777135 RepID=UPI00117DFFDA|nr:hypothetical protein [Caballeronia arvi]